MDYLDYESTLSDVKKTFFSDFKFYAMEKVQDMIKNIPETPYGQLLEVVDPQKETTTSLCGTAKLTPAEVSRMNKIHAVGNTRKAQAISDFVKTMFMRDMVPVDDLSTQNCLYETWFEQITNSDFMYHPESGEQYSPLDLRIQLLYNMSVDYPQVKMHLEIQYKEWIIRQLSEHTSSDMVAVATLRHMFQVSNNFQLFSPYFRHKEEVSLGLVSLISGSIPVCGLILYQILSVICLHVPNSGHYS